MFELVVLACLALGFFSLVGKLKLLLDKVDQLRNRLLVLEEHIRSLNVAPVQDASVQAHPEREWEAEAPTPAECAATSAAMAAPQDALAVLTPKRIRELAQELAQEPAQEPAADAYPDEAASFAASGIPEDDQGWAEQMAYTFEPAPSEEPAASETPTEDDAVVFSDDAAAEELAAEFGRSPEAPDAPEQPGAPVYQPPAPQLPGFVQLIANFVRGGNIWVAGGVLMVLLGFGFLMTYMADKGFFSVELRIALATLTGMGMVGLGLYLRERRTMYALIMQGGGIGVLYLSAFAAAKITTLLPPTAALVVMTLLIIPAVALAVLQNAQVLALFGFFGGFAAPFLLSSGSGNYVALFSYYTLLDLGLLGVCHFRFWR